MKDLAFHHAAIALAAGMAAQVVAARLGIPSIVILLGTGALLGSDVLGILDPSAFGFGRGDMTTLAVTVILFEGGLALEIERLRQQQRSLLLLLTVGAAFSMIIATLAAHWLIDLPWSIAALYGALMIVTGPTVVTPLLSRLSLDRPVRQLLISEGVLIDPLGAIVAIVAAEYVVGHAAILESGWVVVETLGIGGVFGAVAGVSMAFALRRQWIPEDLVNPVVLGSVLLVSAGANSLAADAGLMAAVTQGVVMGNARLPVLRRLREFKEALTVILLSFLFVVLAADLRFAEVQALGWPALGVVAVLMWVARPLSVFVSTIGSGFTIQQRLFVSWICPRGVVAAAMAGLFRILLTKAGNDDGYRLEALVFLTVAVTVTLQGLTASTVARLLRVDVPTAAGTIIVGADRLGRLLARLLVALGRQVVLIDRSPRFCAAARAEGLTVYEGDALQPEVLEDAGARYADTAVTVTRNPELNELVARRMKDHFRLERVLALAEESPEGVVGGEDGPFPGFTSIDQSNRLLHRGRMRLVEYIVGDGEISGDSLGELPFGPGEFALVLQRRDAVFIARADHKLEPGDHLWTCHPFDAHSALAAHFEINQELEPTGLTPAVAR